jgi:hypothetical protein
LAVYGLYVPAAQELHVPELLDDQRPAGQALQVDEPELL